MQKVLISGAAGFIGSYLAQFLIKHNYNVRLLDNYYIPSNLTEIEGIKIEHIDIRDKIDISDIDVLFHLAAVSGINICKANPKEAYDINVRGTYELLRTFHGKVIFASSSSVYGVSEEPIVNETHPIKPISEYGKTKEEAEAIVKYHNHIILRFSNVYGHGLSHKRTVIDIFIERALKEQNLEIHGDGRQCRDFIHIDDTIRSYICAMRSDICGIYNIGGNETLSINNIAELVIKNYRKIYGITLSINRIITDCGRKWRDFTYSSQKAKDVLNYEPHWTVGDEIRGRFNAAKRDRTTNP